MMEIDWTKAPSWAQYHTCDEDGAGYWYETQPYTRSTGFWCAQRDALWKQSEYTKPEGVDWQQSLTKREEKRDV
jgi:hypothetical protein